MVLVGGVGSDVGVHDWVVGGDSWQCCYIIGCGG